MQDCKLQVIVGGQDFVQDGYIYIDHLYDCLLASAVLRLN